LDDEESGAVSQPRVSSPTSPTFVGSDLHRSLTNPPLAISEQTAGGLAAVDLIVGRLSCWFGVSRDFIEFGFQGSYNFLVSLVLIPVNILLSLNLARNKDDQSPTEKWKRLCIVLFGYCACCLATHVLFTDQC
jgi:hypothetical protein